METVDGIFKWCIFGTQKTVQVPQKKKKTPRIELSYDPLILCLIICLKN